MPGGLPHWYVCGTLGIWGPHFGNPHYGLITSLYRRWTWGREKPSMKTDIDQVLRQVSPRHLASQIISPSRLPRKQVLGSSSLTFFSEKVRTLRGRIWTQVSVAPKLILSSPRRWSSGGGQPAGVTASRGVNAITSSQGLRLIVLKHRRWKGQRAAPQVTYAQ